MLPPKEPRNFATEDQRMHPTQEPMQLVSQESCKLRSKEPPRLPCAILLVLPETQRTMRAAADQSSMLPNDALLVPQDAATAAPCGVTS